MSRRVSRALSVFLVYVLLVVVSIVIGLLVLPPLIRQTGTLIVAGPDFVLRAQHWLDRLGGTPVTIDQIAAASATGIGRASEALLSLPFRLASAVGEFVVVVVMSVYVLLASPRLREFLLSLVGPQYSESADAFLKELSATTGGYVRGAVLDVLVVTALIYVGLVILGVNYALALALLAGVGAIIPILGPTVSAIPALAVALGDSPVKALLVLALYVVVHQIEGAVIMPNLIERQSAIPPLLVLFAVAAGAATGSILGILLAIPLAGAGRVIVLRVLTPMVRSWTGAKV
jgi:predicted PurR-regulated permease PerM